MKNLQVTCLFLSLMLASCGVGEISLGTPFLIYRSDGTDQYDSIGIQLRGGLTIALIDNQGAVLQHGSDESYVVAGFAQDRYYYFKKSDVHEYYEGVSASPRAEKDKLVKGPFGLFEFTKITKELGLPPLKTTVKP